MKKIEIKGKESNSVIVVGEEFANVTRYLPSKKVIILTDANVERLYGEQFPNFPRIVIKPGEENKNLITYQYIVDELLALQADRGAFLLAIGGGVVSDIAGFVASTYMRGIRFGFVATTLLAHVDASVGGKNGIDYKGLKNMLGVFNQPNFVLCDPMFLNTLPPSEIACGLAEIVKHTLIADEQGFEYLEEYFAEVLMLETEHINKLVFESISIKAGIVNRDERETGERRLLNFGHTIGHAIEKVNQIPHGYAVSLGIVIAAKFSLMLNYITQTHYDRIVALLTNLKLPVAMPADLVACCEAMLSDKKRANSDMNFVILEKIGKATVHKLPVDTLKEMMEAAWPELGF